MKKSGPTTIKKKLSKEQKAKLVKEQSRKNKLPPNKVETPGKIYKRDKKVDPDS
jgi:hypothetical protein